MKTTSYSLKYIQGDVIWKQNVTVYLSKEKQGCVFIPSNTHKYIYNTYFTVCTSFMSDAELLIIQKQLLPCIN